MSETDNDDERELMLCDDGVSIPMHDMVPVGLLGKFLRKTAPSPIAIESRRIIRVESEQVPKRILKHFRDLQKDVGYLKYQSGFLATTPAIGPIAVAMMSMTTPSGQNSFFAVRAVVRKDGELIDTGYHGFCSFLAGDDFLVTMSTARLPKAREGVDRVMMPNDDPESLVREHRKRMRQYTIVPTEADDVVEQFRRQNLLDVSEYLERGLIRPATTGEISRIRASTKR
ncbi:MAG: hypothetical protein WBD20_27580 [Pirellulaceae bacterium]